MYRIIIIISSSSSTGHWGSSCCIDSSATWVPKKYTPPRNYQFSISPIMFGSGREVGFRKGREKGSWGWALPQFRFIVSFCNFFALHYESQTMYVYQNEGPRGESQGHVPNFGESSLICGLYLACGTEHKIPLKKRKIPTQNGIPSHFFGGKFHSVKLHQFRTTNSWPHLYVLNSIQFQLSKRKGLTNEAPVSRLM